MRQKIIHFHVKSISQYSSRRIKFLTIIFTTSSQANKWHEQSKVTSNYLNAKTGVLRLSSVTRSAETV